MLMWSWHGQVCRACLGLPPRQEDSELCRLVFLSWSCPRRYYLISIRLPVHHIGSCPICAYSSCSPNVTPGIAHTYLVGQGRSSQGCKSHVSWLLHSSNMFMGTRDHPAWQWTSQSIQIRHTSEHIVTWIIAIIIFK